MLAHVQVMTQEEQQAMMAELQARAQAAQRRRRAAPRRARPRSRRWPAPAAPALAAGVDPADPGTWGASGRNDPCPCGSGKKYKHCHGRV